MKTFDAVSLGIMWDRLISITDEIVSALIRTSFTLAVREGFDLSCVLFDADGSPLAQGTCSVPSFTGTAPQTLRHMLRRFPKETLRPGDIVATNDPWMGTGHLYDINIMRPVFRGEHLVGYTLSITHLPDIGGSGIGSTLGEVYEEGLRLPVVKFARGGELNEELFEIIRQNVRVHEKVIGDLMANIACNEVGGRLLLEFMDEYGIDDLSTVSKAIIDQSEQTMRAKLRELPDGVYRNRILIEGLEAPIELACAIEIRGDEVHVDFTGTGAPVRAQINVPFIYTRAWSMYSIKCLTTPGTPNNEGALRPISVTAPEDCILNAQPPFPTGGRHSVGHYIVPLMFGALSQAVPAQVQADGAMMNVFNVRGTHRDGSGFASLYFIAGGFGALEGQDGTAVTPAPSNMGVVSSESWEKETSMTVRSRRLLADSGGPGKWRGGIGQVTTWVNDTEHPMYVALLGQRTQFPALGLFGGKTGTLREFRLNGESVGGKGRYTIEPGGVFEMREAGAGGYGDPKERPRERILADVAQGYVTREGALRDYAGSVRAEDFD